MEDLPLKELHAKGSYIWQFNSIVGHFREKAGFILTYTELIANISNRWIQLHGRLDAIDETEKYPLIRTGKRLETIIVWRDCVIPIIEKYQKVDVPAERAKMSRDAAAALTRLRSGRPMRERRKPTVDEIVEWLPASTLTDMSTQAANKEVLSAISSLRDDLLFQAKVANAIALHQLSSTEALADVVTRYRKAAEGDAEVFPVEAYQLDSVVLPPILRARISDTDPRATWALEQLEEIEPALLHAAGLADVPVSGGREKDVQDLLQSVEQLGRNGMEHLEQLDATMGPFSRMVERDRQAAQQVVAVQ